MRSDGLTLSSSDSHPLFELKESILLAQGTLDDAQQIHLAYIKASGVFLLLCYPSYRTSSNHVPG